MLSDREIQHNPSHKSQFTMPNGKCCVFSDRGKTKFSIGNPPIQKRLHSWTSVLTFSCKVDRARISNLQAHGLWGSVDRWMFECQWVDLYNSVRNRKEHHDSSSWNCNRSVVGMRLEDGEILLSSLKTHRLTYMQGSQLRWIGTTLRTWDCQASQQWFQTCNDWNAPKFYFHDRLTDRSRDRWRLFWESLLSLQGSITACKKHPKILTLLRHWMCSGVPDCTILDN